MSHTLSKTERTLLVLSYTFFVWKHTDDALLLRTKRCVYCYTFIVNLTTIFWYSCNATLVEAVEEGGK